MARLDGKVAPTASGGQTLVCTRWERTMEFDRVYKARAGLQTVPVTSMAGKKRLNGSKGQPGGAVRRPATACPELVEGQTS